MLPGWIIPVVLLIGVPVPVVIPVPFPFPVTQRGTISSSRGRGEVPTIPTIPAILAIWSVGIKVPAGYRKERN